MTEYHNCNLNNVTWFDIWKAMCSPQYLSAWQPHAVESSPTWCMPCRVRLLPGARLGPCLFDAYPRPHTVESFRRCLQCWDHSLRPTATVKIVTKFFMKIFTNLHFEKEMCAIYGFVHFFNVTFWIFFVKFSVKIFVIILKCIEPRTFTTFVWPLATASRRGVVTLS